MWCNKKTFIIVIGFIVLCVISIYYITAYNSEKISIKQKEKILSLFELKAKEDSGVVINTFMWAVANDDIELIKKTSNIPQKSLDTSDIYSWEAVKITDMKLKNKTKYYDYKEFRVDFKSRVGLITYLKSAIFYNSQSYLKKVLFSKYVGFILYKETKESPWIIASYGLHI